MGIAMAIVDYIPVMLFLTAAIILQRDLYHKMSKGAFSLFSAGTITVFMAGLFKATWKLLYNLGICDFVVLNTCFFPMQTTGFLLAALGMLAALCFNQGKGTAYCITIPAIPLVMASISNNAPVPYTSNMLFVIIMVVSVMVLDTCLCIVAARRKSAKAFVAFIFAFLGTMTMGYLSSRDFSKDIFNWIAEGVNSFGQGMLLAGAIFLRKTGIGNPDVTRL